MSFMKAKTKMDYHSAKKEAAAAFEQAFHGEKGVEYIECQEAVKRLTEFLDHELKPEEQEDVQRHLKLCRGCFARFHFEETLLTTIRQRVEAVRAPGSLREKILGMITQPGSATAKSDE